MAGDERPRVLLFDIGGVCVCSPFQAILDYELANNIPPGWVNFSISRTAPNGSWHKLERGEIKMDADFFSAFSQDLRRPELWKEFHERLRRKQNPPKTSESLPPVPEVDGESLFWEMMRVSREPDPHMFPALKKLRASGQFLIGALSNTAIFPEGHPYNEDASGVRSQFDFFISSAHVGLRKPDPRIYELALKTIKEHSTSRGVTDIRPSDVLFLDDIGENLKAAKKAGMRTLKVNLGRTQDAVKELEQITGIPLLESQDRPKL
ncbi:Microsomal epoxide hydrolase [Rasamsonia emersonii CBS 393.64]|uniref:Microsomal epoxide hydrolase n=1 Tax=Rasamsonia emersonii (strain ATCC 16479 / CBS 393.64 / IMI 116815) TaxID=1408163 RepID=A0A0F4YEX2_RASE3|nr:Microsomal epoxide hydrolase [Rasamsonia emersonii CBS 393.64]KKA16168.1 Microsomal epoxide hydrolase [Rasamsonia emersonii CBS 393.64]